MPVDIERKEDIRSKKTERALTFTMLSLLGKYNFRKITVKDICEEALISRATFYTHFTDKYDFLKWWMTAVWPDYILNKEDAYEANEQKINQFINENKTVIKNVLIDADSWTLDALFETLHFLLRLTTEKTIDGAVNPKYIVLSNFYIGGMIRYILWQIKNDFPKDANVMNTHLYEIVKKFQELM